MKHLLVVDDDYGARESLRAVFSGTYKVSLASQADEAMAILSRGRVDVVLLDVVMPQKDGIAVLRELQSLYPDLPVIMVSASTSIRPVVEAIRVGACDFVTKPFDVDEIRLLVQRVIRGSNLQRKVEVLETELFSEFPVEGIVGRAPLFVKAMDDARKAAETDATVVIHGETGTGKELVSRLVHALSLRRDEPFVPVHCAALSETLMESELFGHEKGAFTNATERKLGRFDLAGSGSLFFDEVSEMSPATQVKLLRVLEQKEFTRVGGTHLLHTEARIIVATGKDLAQEVQAGRFRRDLFYRLSVVPIHLPALRERREDVPLLARHFLKYFKQRIACKTEDFSPEAMTLLCTYDWPGNVRELRNLTERILVLNRNAERIEPELLPADIVATRVPDPAQSLQTPVGLPPSLEKAVDDFENRIIAEALRLTGGVQTRAAVMLGTTRRKLRYRMDRLNIRIPDPTEPTGG